MPGGGSVEISHTPHGNFSEDYVYEMREQVNEPRRILESKCFALPLRDRVLTDLYRSNDNHGRE